MKKDTPKLKNLLQIDESQVWDYLGDLVRRSVEETLNALLDAEADRLCNASRYERTQARKDTRAGYYARKLQTRVGEVKLRMPKLRRQTFETAIIERYRRRESSVEEALIEMYLAGVSAGYHRSAVGNTCQPLHHQRAEQEGLQAHRSLAHPSH